MAICPGLIRANGLEFFVDDSGEIDRPPIILIMGLAGQSVLWPETLVQELRATGHRVIRFDNRDVGLSSRFAAGNRYSLPATFARYKLGLHPRAPYDLFDMGADLCGIMDALGIDSAHLVGASMGGMIAQIVAGTQPSRVRSVSLLITSDNSPAFTRTNIRLAWHLGRTRVADETDWHAFRTQAMAFWRSVQGSRYRATGDYMEKALAEHFRRGFTPAGVERQAAAIMATGTLRQWTARIAAPTLIIHGSQDPLIHGRAAVGLKRLVPHAHLTLYPGMGHDLPQILGSRFAHQIRRVVIEGEGRQLKKGRVMRMQTARIGTDHGLLGTF